MGMMNNPNPYGSPYTQNSGQQIGASGLGLQIQSKTVLPNSLSPFAMDKKAVPGGGMPSMVGSNLSINLSSNWHFRRITLNFHTFCYIHHDEMDGPYH